MIKIEKYIIAELYIKVYLTKNIPQKDVNIKIGNLVDKSFLHNEKYSQFHHENRYKMYTFNQLYPLETADKIYKKGKIYTFVIRTIDKNLSQYFFKYLTNEYTDSIKILTIERKTIPRKHIEKIYSITPVVIKSEKGYWKNNISLEQYENRLKTNLIKKFNQFNNTKIDENFELFTFIKFDNRKPIATNYKSICLLGDKLTLNIAENEIAQELAYLALGTGISEMNSRGMGFVNYKWL
ncbi:CRISPR-associated endoribonuclease Cas6 [Clostridium brassicae]|uniref:CRISPR-associated endoribonuclease Cas6 n=1 Tax=Clostridium brassicae TaxID=2999072 RepID=A0ABT4D7S7_9CLOT|nr:CRISPR-associated endoribonuclease Cas6 [Clostridium brassicae]MCY6958360.1 CRISPR-associated endoribonuclease Cas6 [Clostridium brassicae]